MLYHKSSHGHIYSGNSLDILSKMDNKSVNCCVTSPPYWNLRDYGTATWIGGDAECDHVETLNKHAGQRADRNQEGYKKQYKNTCAKCGAIRQDQQLGLERTPEEYVTRMVEIFREVRRVLKADGVLWLNLGDSYAGGGRAGKDGVQKWGGIEKSDNRKYGAPQAVPSGLKPKDLVGIPWRVAFALQADGWWLRQDIIWHKPNPMPESVRDRCTKSHEYIFMLTKSARYYFDSDAIKENTESICTKKRASAFRQQNESDSQTITTIWRNKRSVWTIPTKPYKEAHFAVYNTELIRTPIAAGCPPNGIVLDPFFGSGTTAIEAISQGKNYIGIDLNQDYCSIAAKRIDAYLNQTNIFDSINKESTL